MPGCGSVHISIVTPGPAVTAPPPPSLPGPGHLHHRTWGHHTSYPATPLIIQPSTGYFMNQVCPIYNRCHTPSRIRVFVLNVEPENKNSNWKSQICKTNHPFSSIHQWPLHLLENFHPVIYLLLRCHRLSTVPGTQARAVNHFLATARHLI